MNPRSFLVAALVGATATFCGCNRNGSKSAGGPSGPPKIGYTIHVQNDFTRVIRRGAENAGKDLGAQVEIQGPPTMDVRAAIAIFEGMAQRSPSGLVVMPMQGELWQTPLERVAQSGIPVVTANVTAPGAPVGAWFGQDERNSGVILARQVVKALTAAGQINGTVVVGVCAPGVDVLNARYEGFKDGMKSKGFTVTEPFNVKVDKAANYAAWEALVNSNKDVVAMVGLCSMDLPNLAELKTRSGAKWVAAGYDLNVDTLDAIKAGTVQVAIGQHPYLQGYLPVRALVEHAKDKKPLPAGWVDVGTEIVTKENVGDVYARETDSATEAKWYADYMKEHFADLAKVAKPMPGAK
jgi:simple sugar transport system substrate-binding protein